ncbi:MAG: rubrerythrin family protein [Candidatus Berkelbacteria bacterium]|nr:rubrerythrin family protein [Candidatus Berkelbacteria bacterium]
MSQTQENLLKAFAGESMARNKYTYFAEQARKENLIWIAEVFEETAGNERAHAQEEYEQMKDGDKMTNTYDINTQGTTLENLKHSVAGETFEYTKMYPEFAKIAEDEGETEVARLFTEIMETEEKHAERYQILVDRLEAGKLFESDEEIEWKCLNCGYIHKGTSAPDKCPLCQKVQGYYEGLGVVR